MANMACQSVLLEGCRRRRRSWLRHQKKAKAVAQVSGGVGERSGVRSGVGEENGKISI